ncbi:MAG TPA: hypothetical protein VFO49_07860, partial [Nocardioides sp.]|nr:hypothetical protein [Nocardioides sp.]
MTSALPVSARLAWWATAWLRGQVSPDDLLDAVLDGDVAHLVGGQPVLTALAELRAAGATGFGAAFPREGAPVGLGGPADFNAAAIENGEAIVAVGAERGWVPRRVGPTVEWGAYPAARRQVPDVGEADRELRATLLAASNELADLDVAKWRPEVADELMDLRHRRVPAAPPGVPARCAELAARGLQALGIAELALADDGGALTASMAEQRRAAIAPLDLAARRALVA